MCDIKKCKDPTVIDYAAGKQRRVRGICDRHWNMHCKGRIDLKDEEIYKVVPR